MPAMPAESQRFDLRPGDVAEQFGVHVDTIIRWADEGKLPSGRTPGGQRRFRQSDVDKLKPRPSRATRLVTAVCPYHDAPVMDVVPGSDVWCRVCAKWFQVEPQPETAA